MRLIEFWQTHASEAAGLLWQHILLVAISTGVAVAIGIPVGILAAHRPRFGAPVVWFTNVAQTVPSLAMFGFLLPLPLLGGLGGRVAVTVLTLYALLPIVRTTVAGLRSVDPVLIEAAEALGMTPRQRLAAVELPLALPSIVAGVRVATIVGVGTATIAAAVGAGGLGEYIFRGLSMVDPTVILAGAVPAAALALLLDGLLTMLERGVRSALARGRTARTLRFVTLLFVSGLVAAALLAARGGTDAPSVRIGSKNFTEQIILGEILSQLIEGRTSLRVERRLNLGGTFICDRALRSGDIDMYVEYSGTAHTAIFHQPVRTDPREVFEELRRRYADAALSLFDPLGFENTFAILVRGEDARRLGLRTIGDVSAHAATWQAGFGYEFLQRDDGYPGLARAYGLRFGRPPKAMDLSLIYRALSDRQVDLVAGDATSGLIEAFDLFMLADDRRYFPPYDAAVVARTATLLAHPELRAAVQLLDGRISAAEMRRMNYAVDAERRDPSAVAAAFLERLGII